jgi:peptide-methionine (S)-S-oxide reductase
MTQMVRFQEILRRLAIVDEGFAGDQAGLGLGLRESWALDPKTAIHGVVQTAVGYTGGHVAEPSDERVGRHRTGHAEAVEVWFDPAQVSYAELLQTFWRIHNPTTRNRQGFDFGSQYRSAIFYHDAGQMEAATASREAEQQSLRRQIVTQITPASAFYRAEEYHQRYLEKHGHPACAATIR